MFKLRCYSCKATADFPGLLPETPLELAVMAQGIGWGVAKDHTNTYRVCCSQACHDNCWMVGNVFAADSPPCDCNTTCCEPDPVIIEDYHF